jgi:hypothetical protein
MAPANEVIFMTLGRGAPAAGLPPDGKFLSAQDARYARFRRRVRWSSAVVAVAGWALLSQQTWARAVGIALAALSALANFLFSS